MIHRRCSSLLSCVALLVACSLLQACERTCPPGTTLTGDSCLRNSSSDQPVAQAPVADGGAAARDAEPPTGSSCNDGEQRCSPVRPGTLDSCEAQRWVSQPCANDALCVATSDGATCAECIPGVFRCTGSELEKCDGSGLRFDPVETCGSAALCSVDKRRCVETACEADEHTCGGDSLQRCNDGLTGFEQVQQCDPGMCDAKARKCRTCEPGQVRCSDAVREACDDAGDAFAAAACPEDAPFCVGSGECAQCSGASDCTPRACHVAACSRGRCEDSPEPEGPRNCRYADGTTIRPPSENGEIYVIAGGAAFHILYGEDLEAHFGGVARVIDTPDTCGTKPAAGTNLQEVSSDSIVRIGADGMWHHIVTADDLTDNCGGLGSVRKIPDGSLDANEISRGADI